MSLPVYCHLSAQYCLLYSYFGLALDYNGIYYKRRLLNQVGIWYSGVDVSSWFRIRLNCSIISICLVATHVIWGKYHILFLTHVPHLRNGGDNIYLTGLLWRILTHTHMQSYTYIWFVCVHVCVYTSEYIYIILHLFFLRE